MSKGIKEQRKKIQDSITFLSGHENQELAFKEMLLIAKTSVAMLNILSRFRDPKDPRFILVDKEEFDAETSSSSVETSPGEQVSREEFSKAFDQADPPTILIG